MQKDLSRTQRGSGRRRKALKRLRYGLEFLSGLCPEKALRRYLQGCKELQEDLGGLNDAVTAIAMADEAGRYPTAPRYDGYVALGCIIRGETYHFEIVSNESARGIMALTMDGIAIGNGILTTENEAQAIARADIREGCARFSGRRGRLDRSDALSAAPPARRQ